MDKIENSNTQEMIEANIVTTTIPNVFRHLPTLSTGRRDQDKVLANLVDQNSGRDFSIMKQTGERKNKNKFESQDKLTTKSEELKNSVMQPTSEKKTSPIPNRKEEISSVPNVPSNSILNTDKHTVHVDRSTIKTVKHFNINRLDEESTKKSLFTPTESTISLDADEAINVDSKNKVAVKDMSTPVKKEQMTKNTNHARQQIKKTEELMNKKKIEV